MKLKASLLLLVFSLNSLRSLACAMHADRFVYSVINTLDDRKGGHGAIHKSCKEDDDDDCKCPEKKIK